MSKHLRNINLNVSKMHRRKGHDQKTIQIQSHLWRSRETIQMRLILQDCRIDSCMGKPIWTALVKLGCDKVL